MANADSTANEYKYVSDKMSKWATKNVHSIPSLFGALIKCLLISAPYVFTRFASGAITLSEIPAAIDDQNAKDLVAEIEAKLAEEGLSVEDLHKTMIKSYDAETLKFEIGEKARYAGRVVTLVKPMEGDRWQIKYTDGHKETVAKDAIKPYKSELEARKELYGEGLEEGGNLRESARARLSVELRQFVARFVQDMGTAREGKTDYDEMMDAYADLAIRTANWVGLPVEVLKNINYILSDDCLCCDMWDLVNHIVKLTNK